MKALKAYFDYAVSDVAQSNKFNCSMFNNSMFETKEEKIVNAAIDENEELLETNWSEVILGLLELCSQHIEMTTTQKMRLRRFTVQTILTFEAFEDHFV